MLPTRFAIELVPHDPAWVARARAEDEALRAILGDVLVRTHHVGSTSIPTIRAKPIVDLLAVVTALEAVDPHRAALEARGYEWRGAFGQANRRYCILAAGTTRLVHAQFYEAGDPIVESHLTYRDYLLAHPEEARAYEADKLRARALYPDDLARYGNEKTAWIKACDERARAWARSRPT